MTNHRSSHHRQHPDGDVALLEADDPQHATPDLHPDEPIASHAPHISLLAATALGFAFSSGATDGNVRTLTVLAEPHTDNLLQAGAAVLELEVAPRHTRAIAAELLGQAARRCA
jgi:hypothetical protein